MQHFNLIREISRTVVYNLLATGESQGNITVAWGPTVLISAPLLSVAAYVQVLAEPPPCSDGTLVDSH